VTPSEGSDLGARVARGLSWKAASQGLRQVTRVAVMVVIAHELSPHEYGLAGMVLVLSTLVLIFADLALGSALVQRETLTEDDRSTVFWASTGAGLVFTGLGIALAEPIAAFFGQHDVAPLMRVFSLTFVVTALGTTQAAMLARDLSFRSLELRAMAATIVGAAAGIGLALAGTGAWAIIAQQLAVASVSTLLLWVLSPWRPRFTFSLARLRALGAFGLRVFGTRVIFYLERNADNVLVGRVLGSAALGIYALSYNIMLVPLEQVGGPMAEVLFPAFSRMQDQLDRLRRAWLRAVRLLAAVVMPALLMLIALAPDVVHVVLGNKWSAATPVIQLLAWVGLHQSLQRFNSSVLQAVDRTGRLLVYAVVSAVVTVTSFAVGLEWGVVGVAAAYAISSTVVAPVYLVFTMRAAQSSVREFAANLGGVTLAAIGAAAAAWALRESLLGAVQSPALRLAVIVPLAAGLYLLLCRVAAPELVHDVRRMVPARMRDRVRRVTLALRPARV
jgi:O-antigen/teichoic acid export membrane protein